MFALWKDAPQANIVTTQARIKRVKAPKSNADITCTCHPKHEARAERGMAVRWDKRALSAAINPVASNRDF